MDPSRSRRLIHVINNCEGTSVGNGLEYRIFDSFK